MLVKGLQVLISVARNDVQTHELLQTYGYLVFETKTGSQIPKQFVDLVLMPCTKIEYLPHLAWNQLLSRQTEKMSYIKKRSFHNAIGCFSKTTFNIFVINSNVIRWIANHLNVNSRKIITEFKWLNNWLMSKRETHAFHRSQQFTTMIWIPYSFICVHIKYRIFSHSSQVLLNELALNEMYELAGG